MLLYNSNQIGGALDSIKVFERYGEKLKEKLKRDHSFHKTIDIDTLNELPINFILASNINENDKEGEYLEWIVNSYINDGIKRYEDLLSRVKPSLIKYKYLLTNKKLSTIVDKWNNERDINTYCGISGCDKIIINKQGHEKIFKKIGLETLLDKYKDEIDQIDHIDEKNKKPSEIYYQGENIKVYVPRTEEESIHLGAGTKWCTAAKNDNMFNDYNEQGDLYIIVPKNPTHVGEKYQLFFSHNYDEDKDEDDDYDYEDQYMDENDKDITLNDLLKKYPEIINIIPFSYLILYLQKKEFIEWLEKVNKILNFGYINNKILSKAIEYKLDIKILKTLLEKMDDLGENIKTDQLKIKYMDINCVKLLLKHGVKLTPEIFYEAIVNNKPDIVNLCIENGVKPSPEIFYEAIKNNMSDIVELCIQNGIKPSVSTINMAIKNNMPDLVELCLENKIIDANYLFNVLITINNFVLVKLYLEMCLKYGLKVDKHQMLKIKNIDLLKILIENYNLHVDLEILNHILKSLKLNYIRLNPSSYLNDKNYNLINFILKKGIIPNQLSLTLAIETYNHHIISSIISIIKPTINDFNKVLESVDNNNKESLLVLFLHHNKEIIPNSDSLLILYDQKHIIHKNVKDLILNHKDKKIYSTYLDNFIIKNMDKHLIIYLLEHGIVTYNVTLLDRIYEYINEINSFNSNIIKYIIEIGYTGKKISQIPMKNSGVNLFIYHEYMKYIIENKPLGINTYRYDCLLLSLNNLNDILKRVNLLNINGNPISSLTKNQICHYFDKNIEESQRVFIS
jgi:hypothetical protein